MPGTPERIFRRWRGPLVAVAVLLATTSVGAAEWPQFRGPNRDGLSPETGLDLTWGASGPRVVWRVPGGKGYSGLSIAGGRLFTLVAQGRDELAVAHDLGDGRLLWSVHLDAAFEDSMGDGPRATPTVADGVVYALGARGVLAAIDAASGEVRWRSDLKRLVGARPPQWGVSTSPLLLGDRLLLDAGGRDGASVVALDRRDGSVQWTSQSDIAGYSAPIEVVAEGVRQVVFFTGTRIVSVDPEDGSAYWSLPWRTSYDVNAATPVVVAPNRLFVSSGYDVGGALLRLGAAGGRATVSELWRNREMKNQFSSSIYDRGILYGFDNKTLKAVDARDGSELWAQRGLGHGSLILADGRLVVLGERCDLVIAEATGEAYRELARAVPLAGKCWTAPSLAGGRLYLRNEEEIVSIDVAPGQER